MQFSYSEFHQLQTQYFLQTVYIYTHKNYRIQFIKCVKSEETKTFENLMTDCLKIWPKKNIGELIAVL